MVAARELRIVEAAGVRRIEAAERLFVQHARGVGRGLLDACQRSAGSGEQHPGAEICADHRPQFASRRLEDVARDGAGRVCIAKDAPCEVVDATEVQVVQLAEAIEVAGGGAGGEKRGFHASPASPVRAA